MIIGRARLLGDNVGIGDILSNVHLAEHMAGGGALTGLVPKLFAGVRPDLGATLQPGDIIVAGGYFGFGSSGEFIPLTLKAAGIPCIIARSFARTFYRAGVNLGVLPIECGIDANEFDTIEVNPEAGQLTVGGCIYTFGKFQPLLMDIIRQNGLLNYIRANGTL